MAEVWSNVDSGTKLDHNKFLSVLCPTSNNMINIDTSVALLFIAKGVGRQLQYCASVKTGIPSSRGVCTTIAKSYYGVSMIRGLWLDSDILIKNPDVVVEYIKKADKENFNFEANYRTGTFDYPTNIIMKNWDATDCYTSKEELDNMEDLKEIAWSGLGFYYGDINLDYTFWADSYSGEDYNFFKESNLHPRFAKNIKLGHGKNIFL